MLAHFFSDLESCSCLESLRITIGIDLIGDKATCGLPKVQLAALPRLKCIELVGWMPQQEFTLPSECKLSVSVVCDRACFWKEQWKVMQRHLTVLFLDERARDVPRGVALKWPGGLKCLARLQYFRYHSYMGSMGQDLAVLKGIPHVYLWFANMASLTLTEGTWQSLEVRGEEGLCITFTDAAAFVRGTERFLFVSRDLDTEVSQPMCAAVREACKNQLKDCYQCRFIDSRIVEEANYIVRLSNCKETMQLKPSADGEMVPSGGLRDGYAGTPEVSPLWDGRDGIAHKSLVRQEDFWPEQPLDLMRDWEPSRWVFGQ